MNNSMNNIVRRGEIWWADLSGVVGSEQGGLRPVLIVQNDTGNKYSPTVIAAPITSRQGKTKIPTHVKLSSTECGVPKDSIILLEQVRTIDKSRLKERLGVANMQVLEEVTTAILISFGIMEKPVSRPINRPVSNHYNRSIPTNTFRPSVPCYV